MFALRSRVVNVRSEDFLISASETGGYSRTYFMQPADTLVKFVLPFSVYFLPALNNNCPCNIIKLRFDYMYRVILKFAPQSIGQ